jgi:hypothetical protein
MQNGHFRNYTTRTDCRTIRLFPSTLTDRVRSGRSHREVSTALMDSDSFRTPLCNRETAHFLSDLRNGAEWAPVFAKTFDVLRASVSVFNCSLEPDISDTTEWFSRLRHSTTLPLLHIDSTTLLANLLQTGHGVRRVAVSCWGSVVPKACWGMVYLYLYHRILADHRNRVPHSVGAAELRPSLTTSPS